MPRTERQWRSSVTAARPAPAGAGRHARERYGGRGAPVPSLPRESPAARAARTLGLPGARPGTTEGDSRCSCPSTPRQRPRRQPRRLLEGIAADLGLIPNLAATAAASPALLAGFDGLRRAVATTKLDPVLREVAGLAVGVAVDNHYGVAFHSTMLAGLGVDEADIDAMRAGGAPAEPVAAAVHALAREAAVDRGKVADGDDRSRPRCRAVHRGRPRGAPRGPPSPASSA